MNDRLIKVEELAVLVGTSCQTIDNWYRWKKLNPEHELASLLPDYQQNAPRQTRLWNYSDVWKIIEFKASIPHGCKGILGEVTQKYRKKG